jgi:hypothetical protein
MNQVLLGAKISFCGLNRGMAQEQLDLLKLTARSPAQFGARSASVMRRDARNTDYLRISREHLPDRFFT